MTHGSNKTVLSGEAIYFGWLFVALMIAVVQTGCGFYIGIDYNGKTGVDRRTVTEDFVRGKNERN
jgi:hypothetical protein